MFDLKTTVRRAPHGARLAYAAMAEQVLGDKYELSLVLCGDELARRMNMEYRKKSYFPNVLSFELSPHEGEIFLNVRKAEREARALGISVAKRIGLLYVHGLYHLKGMDHSDRMEALERATLKKFKLL
ncbi:MAG TPA: rRNA maturation RNase YbeY [Candidatus Paceibacterota bacterium]|nr:rRNA maturation RNase YbeY [Candidatus Paceibacterota bacterium]